MRTGLLVTNEEARRVSPRLRAIIAKALSADLDLEVVETKAPQHAAEVSRHAAGDGVDVVVAFGGDGTVNEVANGLADARTAMAVLPGGARNVICRNLGIPPDIVEATAFLLNRLQETRPRRVNMGRAGDRYFLSSCGAGIDAAMRARIDGRGFWNAVSAMARTALEYRGAEPSIEVEAPGVSEVVAMAVVANAPRYAQLGRLPVRLAPDAGLEEGLDLVGVRSPRISVLARLGIAALGDTGRLDSKHVVYSHDLQQVHLRSGGKPFPVHVDGEPIGDVVELEVAACPSRLSVLA